MRVRERLKDAVRLALKDGEYLTGNTDDDGQVSSTSSRLNAAILTA